MRFENVELNHIAWATGRDVLLQPAQHGERLLCFVTPYADLNR